MAETGESGQGSRNTSGGNSFNTWTGAANVIGLGLQGWGAFSGNKDEGLSRDDQRWLADFNWKQSLRNEEFQRDLAKNGIRMRVEDAVAAGLHPLVGAGINPASGSFAQPVMAPGSSRSNFGEKLSNFGQNISRAASSTMTNDERLYMHANTQKALAEADFAKSQALLARQQVANLGKTPPMPQSHIKVMNQDGTIATINNPDIAGALMSDPLGAWGTSIKNTVQRIQSSPKWDIIPGFIRGRKYKTDSETRGRDRARQSLKTGY